MISLYPAQSRPSPPFFPSTSPLPADLSSTLARSKFLGVTLDKNFSKKSEIPALYFQSLTDSVFALFGSCQNISFIFTVFTKTPGGTLLPHPTPKVLFELLRCDSSFASHQSRFVTSHLFIPNLALVRLSRPRNHT